MYAKVVSVSCPASPLRFRRPVSRRARPHPPGGPSESLSPNHGADWLSGDASIKHRQRLTDPGSSHESSSTCRRHRPVPHGRCEPAFAAGLDGAKLSIWWALPFVGMLLSIAVFPLVNMHFWEHNQGKIAAFWAALMAVPLAMTAGIGTALDTIGHTILLEIHPLHHAHLALFTVAGGIWSAATSMARR